MFKEGDPCLFSWYTRHEECWISGIYVGMEEDYIMIAYRHPLPEMKDINLHEWDTYSRNEKKKYQKYVGWKGYGIIVSKDRVKPDKNKLILKRYEESIRSN